MLSVPKDRADASLRMPSAGWPIMHYMDGTGGNRFTFVGEGLAAALADEGIAVIGIDQPLHGLRQGATADGVNFYNPRYPYAHVGPHMRVARVGRAVDRCAD